MRDSLIFIGHRGAGKSTLGALYAQKRGMPFFDLDHEIEHRTGRPAAELVAENEPAFRIFERQTLGHLLMRGREAVIAVGGGIEDIPAGVPAIWIDREGWEEAARTGRQRLRSDIPFEEEVAWMKDTREPRYARLAHTRVRIERGCTPNDARDRIDMHASLMESASHGGLSTTWLVASGPEQLTRCEADTGIFGTAGVEIRSDIFPSPPVMRTPWLASLRTPSDDFFVSCTDAAAFDCDIDLLDHLVLEGLSPRPLIISTHPKDVSLDNFLALKIALEKVRWKFPEWAGQLSMKYAPLVKSWVEMRFAHELCRDYLRKGGVVSLIPQGKQWNWVRAYRLRSLNTWNYASPGTVAGIAPPLEYFFPMAAGNVPSRYCAVIGDPIDHSIGDVWHRAAGLRAAGLRAAGLRAAGLRAAGPRIEDLRVSEDVGYLRIPLTDAELDIGLFFLYKLDLLGLSVTAPHKGSVIRSVVVVSRVGLEVGNTLTLRDGGWVLTDTDEAGMDAALSKLKAEGIAPGSVALFGRGGASHAVLRSLRRNGWNPIDQVAAREGWGALRGRSYMLVVNAAGPGSSAHDCPPLSEAWLDLHYRNVQAPPPGVRIHRSGMDFFAAQAAAQRREWGLELAE